MAHYYSCKVTQNEGGKGGKEGRVGTLSEPNNPNFVNITIQSPGEFKGPVGDNNKSLYWTPEDIFVSSVAACFFTTFVAIAEASNLEYTSFSVGAKGTLAKVENVGNMITEIVLSPSVTINNPQFKKKALTIMEKTEKGCLIARSMKTKVTSEFEVKEE